MRQQRPITTFVVLLLLSAGCVKDKDPVTPTGPNKLVEVNPPATIRSAPANTSVSQVTVKLQTAAGAPVSGQDVFFSILSGNGSLTGTATVTTDANGVAAAPTWTLGKFGDGAGAQVMRAISGTLDPLDIQATVQTAYTITLRFFGSTTMTAGQTAAFTNAAKRLQGIITGDVADVQLSNQDVTSCAAGQPNVTELVDDIVIYAQSVTIDGVGGTLGRARPCFVRIAGATCGTGCVNIPVIGLMEFDTADLAQMEADGSLQNVIQHEMLHVLGVGSLWNTFSVLQGGGGADPRYTGTNGVNGCKATGGTVTCASTVPVENTGGTGTRDSHWREATFNNELMTGFLNTGVNPMSALTVRSLADLTYVVNTADDDAYTIPGGLIVAGSSSQSQSSSLTTSPNWEISAGPLYGITLSGSARFLRYLK